MIVKFRPQLGHKVETKELLRNKLPLSVLLSRMHRTQMMIQKSQKEREALETAQMKWIHIPDSEKCNRNQIKVSDWVTKVSTQP